MDSMTVVDGVVDAAVVVDASTSLEELERLITQGAADLASAERDWMLVIAEFDRREAHLEWSAPSCATWLAWFAGVDVRAARERVRVSQALAADERLSEAMASGQVSYSKARAITRVATAESMRAWIDIAVSSTANQLERLVAAVRRQGDDGLDEEQRQQVSWSFDHRVASDGSIVITVRLPKADGTAVLSAIERYVSPPCRDADGVWVPVSARRADAVVDLAIAATDHRACTGPTRSGDQVLVTLHCSVDELRRQAASATGGDCCHHDHGNDTDDGNGDGDENHDVAIREAAFTVQGVGDSTATPLAVPTETAMRLLCDSLVEGVLEDAEGDPLLMGRRSREPRGALRRALEARDRHCRMPCCTQLGRLQFHHSGIYWGENGPTDIDNMLRLCRFHHRWVHEGGWHVVPDAEHGFVFVAPDGSTLPAAPVTVSGDARRVRALARHRKATPGVWQGDRLDVDVAISNILRRVDTRPTSRAS